MSEGIKPAALKVGNKLFSANDWKSAGSYSTRHTDTFVEELYTKGQLQPRVKMTREQANDFKDLHAQYDLLSEALDNIYQLEHIPLKDWITKGKLRQNEILIANIWNDYDPNHPEETIEIIPTEKWFVRSKGDHYMLLLKGFGSYDKYGYFADGNLSEASQFDTKEEADKWVNPLVEAVLLPIGDE